MSEKSALFPALLKFWRGRRGLSQLDLALRAGVSSRHVSFLETGRSAPSVEMVMLLGGTLALSLRDRNALLRAAGFDAEFEEDERAALSDPQIRRAVDRMLVQHEPYPMLVMNGRYDVLMMNSAAARMVSATLGEVESFNAVAACFDPQQFKPFVIDWEDAALELLRRLQHEVLLDPQNGGLQSLLDEVLAMPDIPPEWARPDFSENAKPVFALRFRLAGAEVAFMTTLMRFTAPQSVALDELQVEGWFPLDDATESLCAALALG